LRVNRRNTRQIFSFLTRFGGTKLRTSHQAPLGDPPEVIRHRTAGEQRENIDKKLGWLLKGGVSLDQIVLIGTHRLEKSFLADRPTLYGLPVEAIRDDGTATSEGALRYSTPHRFKGLESKVVLLCDVDGNEKSCAKRHLYVAASRAQHLLYVFAQHGAVSGLELGEGEPQS
jgi:superfamily I DNA/RNA helicase